MRVDDPFVVAVLMELATAPPPGGMSLPRLAKRLGLGVSVVMRQLSLMGDAVIGGQPRPGLGTGRADRGQVGCLSHRGGTECRGGCCRVG